MVRQLLGLSCAWHPLVHRHVGVGRRLRRLRADAGRAPPRRPKRDRVHCGPDPTCWAPTFSSLGVPEGTSGTAGPTDNGTRNGERISSMLGLRMDLSTAAEQQHGCTLRKNSTFLVISLS